MAIYDKQNVQRLLILHANIAVGVVSFMWLLP